MEGVKVKFSNIATFKYGKMPIKEKIASSGYPLFSGYRVVGYYQEKMFDTPQLIVIARGVGGAGTVKISPANCYITNLSLHHGFKTFRVATPTQAGQSVEFFYPLLLGNP